MAPWWLSKGAAQSVAGNYSGGRLREANVHLKAVLGRTTGRRPMGDVWAVLSGRGSKRIPPAQRSVRQSAAAQVGGKGPWPGGTTHGCEATGGGPHSALVEWVT
jgi:hypothetical protein